MKHVFNLFSRRTHHPIMKWKILTREYPGSFGNIFGRNAINNGLLMVEVPRLVQRLREVFSSNTIRSQQNEILEPSRNRESLDSTPSAPQSRPEREKKLTRRTGWCVLFKSLFPN